QQTPVMFHVLNQIVSRQCPGRGSNPYAPCGAPDFKSGASASSSTQAYLFSMNYRDTRFRLFYVAYLSPMKSDHFEVLQSLRLNHPLRGVTGHELHITLRR